MKLEPIIQSEVSQKEKHQYSILTHIPFPSLSLLQGNLPNPGIGPRYPALQADSLPAEP